MASFGLIDVNSNRVARLHGILAPAKEAKRRRAASLSHPVLHFSLIILDIHHDKAMGIGPYELGDGSGLQNDRLTGIVSSISMMCEHGGANHQQAQNQGKRYV